MGPQVAESEALWEALRMAQKAKADPAAYELVGKLLEQNDFKHRGKVLHGYKGSHGKDEAEPFIFRCEEKGEVRRVVFSRLVSIDPSACKFD